MTWEYPEPRSGWRGEFDRFIEPGATRAELALEFGLAVLGGAAMLAYALTSFPQACRCGVIGGRRGRMIRQHG